MAERNRNSICLAEMLQIRRKAHIVDLRSLGSNVQRHEAKHEAQQLFELNHFDSMLSTSRKTQLCHLKPSGSNGISQ